METEGRDTIVSYLPEQPGSEPVKEKVPLPASFDLRQKTQIGPAPDQGGFGTCWAFASLMALETSMKSQNRTPFSADHMSIQNSFQMGQNDGGEYTMAMAYLLAWQGPVAERADPYGDGVSPEGLSPVCHVQEVRILPEKNYEKIKRAVYETGGVQSSLYIPMDSEKMQAEFYRADTCALYYGGNEEPNHDVVIIGWDDGYPKENFRTQPKENGAFLCMNSWGSSFGENGSFYVSYEDTNIGSHNVLYSRAEGVNNYAEIYQTDLCGWLGQLGYGGPRAWFSNVYEARSNEKVKAAGFYATMEQTSYRVYVAKGVPETGDRDGISGALSSGTLVAAGRVEDAGFYTVPFKQAVSVEKGERFAVIVEIETPGAVHPVAIEYGGGERPVKVDLSDGEGYISLNGNIWKRAEEQDACNLCLKAYTSRARQEKKEQS